jgi:peptidoglycan hydrolase-like protein with peptidoglycan-binding domain
MNVCMCWAGSAAIAISLCAGAGAAGRSTHVAQNATGAGRGAVAPGGPTAADAPPALPANSPEQIRKAQTELKRLDCLKGRIDGKLGDQTRQAVKKFWTSGGQPAAEVTITDELIANLAERGDNFCRPKRRFFGFGGRPGGNFPFPSRFAPGTRPSPVPAAGAQPLPPADAH